MFMKIVVAIVAPICEYQRAVKSWYVPYRIGKVGGKVITLLQFALISVRMMDVAKN
jgi:hypothetical protein